MVGDFLALYNRDPFVMVWEDDLRPLLALLARLKYEPWSVYRSEELGDERFFGYDAVAQRIDNVQDELRNVSYTIVKVNAGKKPVKKPTYVERPQQKKENGRYQPASLDDVGSFFTGM